MRFVTRLAVKKTKKTDMYLGSQFVCIDLALKMHHLASSQIAFAKSKTDLAQILCGGTSFVCAKFVIAIFSILLL